MSTTTRSTGFHISEINPEIQFKTKCADPGIQCKLKEDLPKRAADSVIAGSKRDFAIQAQPLQVDREVQAREGFGTFAEYFTESRRG